MLNSTRLKWGLLFGVVLAVAVTGLRQAVTARPVDTTKSSSIGPLFETRQGPLLVTVDVSGTIKPGEQVILTNEVEGQTRIISIVDEGAEVKAGDVLIELDSSEFFDEREEEKIEAKTAEADFVSARENLEVVKNQAESDTAAAELAYQFAKLDLEKYTNGDFPMSLKDIDTQIALAEGDAKRAEDQLEGSQRLAEKKFITQTELEADKLEAVRTQLNLELAKQQKDLLKEFTYNRQVDELKSEVHQTEMALERVRRSGNADVIRAKAELAAADVKLKHEQDRLVKLTKQIESCTIRAPRDGVVVYATSVGDSSPWHRQEPLEEGASVYERQKLIYLPTAGSFKAGVQIQEASRAKVQPGLPVRLTTDALPGREFFGRVASVDLLPDSSSRWMNPDSNVFNASIQLEGNVDGLRTGMNCEAEIIVKSFEDTTYVPVQSVVRLNGEEHVYVAKDGALTPRPVKTGMNNGDMIVIDDGLARGERVAMMPPLTGTEMNIGGEASKKLREMMEQMDTPEAES